MTRQLLLFFSATTILASCDTCTNSIQRNVDDHVDKAKTEMNKNISGAKATLSETYKKVLDITKDSTTANKINHLYSSIALTSKYIDSLTMEMEKLDDQNPNNVDLIKRSYLYEGIGDSLFNKVKASYSMAIDIAKYDTTKMRLIKVRDTFTDDTKNLYFELSGPLGVIIILYGIELELIEDGTSSLYNYSDDMKSN